MTKLSEKLTQLEKTPYNSIWKSGLWVTGMWEKTSLREVIRNMERQ